MRYRVALAFCVMVLAGGGVATARPVVPDLSGHWVVTTTVTDGNAVDQARIGHSADLYCAQSGEAMTCHSQGGTIFLTGGHDGTVVQMSGYWGTEEIHVTLYGALVNSKQMQGHFDTDMTVGLGAYEASGEWKAIKVGY